MYKHMGKVVIKI